MISWAVFSGAGGSFFLASTVRGAGVTQVHVGFGFLQSLRGADVGVPLAVMTYYNIAHRMGLERFADSLLEAGVSGCILPDLPLEEAEPWLERGVHHMGEHYRVERC